MSIDEITIDATETATEKDQERKKKLESKDEDRTNPLATNDSSSSIVRILNS